MDSPETRPPRPAKRNRVTLLADIASLLPFTREPWSGHMLANRSSPENRQPTLSRQEYLLHELKLSVGWHEADGLLRIEAAQVDALVELHIVQLDGVLAARPNSRQTVSSGRGASSITVDYSCRFPVLRPLIW